MTYKDLTQINLEEISKNEKITMVKMSEFGFPIVLNLKLTDLRFKNYAQYNNCLEVVGKLPRKRKDLLYRIKPYEDFVIYPGTITMDEFKDFKKVQESDDVTITEWGTCFDSDTFKDFTNIDKKYLVNSDELGSQYAI